MPIAEAVTLLEALASVHRLRILQIARAAGREGVRAGEISAKLGRSPSGLSRHLALLVAAGVMRRTDEGRTSTFQVDEDCEGRLKALFLELCAAVGDPLEADTNGGAAGPA